jgi:predicted ATPase
MGLSYQRRCSSSRACVAAGYQMIHSINIRNFRCFQELQIEGCRRINVIVGDNGAGKTALLEAIFMALGSSPEIGVRLRQQRGLEGSFSGSIHRIEEALWKDLFYQSDWGNSISIELRGKGPEARSVKVFRGQSRLTIPLQPTGQEDEIRTAAIMFRWIDSEGKEHEYTPKVTHGGLQVEAAEEDLPDFFYFSANQTIASGENAARFSDLSRTRRAKKFVQLFTQEYPWIEDLNIEVLAGSPVIYATLRETEEKIPLANVSGGINRMVSIMLALASRSQSVVLVDEIENGLYYRHQAALWRGLLSLTRDYEGQLFVTTHNEEWLEALFEVAGSEASDVALWRIERSQKGPVLRQFSGRQAAAALRVGEIR